MVDESQDRASETGIENPVTEPVVAPLTLKKSNKNLWILASIVMGVLCCCSILCLVIVGTGMGKVMVERSPVEAVLDTFMKNMEAKDVESVYDLFSPRAQRQMPVADLEKLIQGNNYQIFEGYEHLTVEQLNLTAAVNTNPDMPQGTVANVVASISYRDGFTGRLTAVLEKVDGKWRFYNFNVTVPPDKFQPRDDA